MKILELYLKAFGPFTEQRLELTDSDGGGGLCVIHGTNEAGKSSALRAIHDLLYGIPARSPDDFVHRYADLRVGARLLFADGEGLDFVRRKGTKSTIRCYESDAPRDEGRLAELVRQVPESVFRNFYGLDHDRLSHGSQALLEDDGELGRTLYAAGLGAGNLRALLSDLESEAEALFAPRGTTRRINARLAALKQVQTRIKQESLRPQAWLEAERAEREAQARLERLDAELEQRRIELSRLERVRRTQPALARRRQWRRRLEEMPALPDLGMDFESRLREVRARRQRAIEEREAARDRRSALEARRAALELAPAMLAEKEALIALQSRWGATHKEREELPRRQAERARLESDLDHRLSLIDSSGSLRLPESVDAALARGRRIRELAERFPALEEAVASQAERMDAARQRLELLDQQWAEQGEVEDPSRLRRAIEQAEAVGDIDARISERQRAWQTIETAYQQGHAGLGRSIPPPDALENASVPEADLLEQFVASRSALDRRAERLVEVEQEQAAERRSVEEDLLRLRSERAVPSESDLADRRRERDDLWRQVRNAWQRARSPAQARAENAPAAQSLLSEAYPDSVTRADELADRLRVDADRVARQAALIARQSRLAADAAGLQESRERLESDRARHEREWQALWSTVGMDPGSPAVMSAWRRRFEKWLDLAEQRRGVRSEWQREVALRTAARDALQQALAALGSLEEEADRGVGGPGKEVPEPLLAPRLITARVLADRLESASLRRDRLAEAREQAARESVDAERAHRRSRARLDDWRAHWREAVEGLGLSESPHPGEALDRLEAMRDIRDAARERDRLAERIRKMEEDIFEFEADLHGLVERIAPDLRAEGSSDGIVRTLQDRLRAAEAQEARRIELEAALTEERDRLQTAEQALEGLSQQIEALCAEAGVAHEADLDPVLRAWQERSEARREQALAETQLAENGDGLSIEQLESSAAEVDPDRLPGRIAALEREIEEWTAAGHQARTDLVSAREALRRMDGSAEVAELAASAEQERAAIRREVDRYVVLRLAREILEREIESYRKRNQAPVLARAREIFERLTLGVYPVLEVDHDEAGGAQLMASSADGRSVRIDAMSSGTRDQLFLALRLATLEDSLERSEPMPLIADDVLVHFDDDRSEATLEVLADLGTRTQVLLFTHHSKVRDQALGLGQRARVLELMAPPS